MKETRLQNVDNAIRRYNQATSNLRSRWKDDPKVLRGSRESGAVRRASLDLSRALADLRKPDREE